MLATIFSDKRSNVPRKLPGVCSIKQELIMKNPFDVQFGLTQTWLSVWARSSELAQEQQEKWLRLAADVAHQYASERQTELRELQQAEDWKNLLQLMPGVAARSAQNRLAVAQGIYQTIVNNQSAAVKGWQELVRESGAATQTQLQRMLGEIQAAASAKGSK
jgi:hypothetical protein